MATVGTKLQKPPYELRDLDENLYEYLNTLVARIERILTAHGRASARGWQPANTPASGNRDLDANAGTLDETRKTLTRLIKDLKEGGQIAS